MAAKLLHSLADDNEDLQKQIGCMTGILQIFDRQQVLTGRRLNHKRLPPGDSHYSNGRSERESLNGYRRHSAADMNLNKGLSEKHRVSTESSRASFSSSCSSSYSSLDCNKPAQPEASFFDRIIFPDTPSRNSVIADQSASSHLGRQSLDLRDVVKDSMYREARGLSVKTTSREGAGANTLKHKDSPRPLQLSKSADRSYGVESIGKQSVSPDLKESLRVLAQLREAPRFYNETRDRPRSSYESKDGPWHAISKDAPRFSCDGRETNHLSFESRDTIKSTSKVKELPRLSLDTRVVSSPGSNFGSKPNYGPKDSHTNGNLTENGFNTQQSLGNPKRPPGVVAKLMGLEALPDSSSTSYSQSCLTTTSQIQDDGSFSRSLKMNEASRSIRMPKSPRSSSKEPASPRWRNPDLIMKPVSKLPIETAPWKQMDGSRSSKKLTLKPAKVGAKMSSSFPSVYSEIEKRLKDIEFDQSGKDLRALKQILEAMQAKGLLDTKKEEQGSNFVIEKRDYEPKCDSPSQKPRFLSQRNQQSNYVGASTVKAYESPIVIMKPAKLFDRSSIISSSVTTVDAISSSKRVPSSGYAEAKKESLINRTGKDPSPRTGQMDSAVNSSDKKASVRNTKSTQTSTGSQHFPKESIISSEKNSGSVSPRLQQKKLELEKRSRPPTHPSDSSKPRRQSNRQSTEAVSPGGRHRLRSARPPNDDRLSQITKESRIASHTSDYASVQSDPTVVFDKVDLELKSNENSPSMKAANSLVYESLKKKSGSRLEDHGTLAALSVVAPENPSPISVLDPSVCGDDALSPVRQGDGARNSTDGHSEDHWNNADNFQSNNVGSGLTSEINRKKLQNIENLVQKLRRLNSTHNEASTDYIASLCENTNPDHRYISEILLASGLLLRDLGSGLSTFQLHSSGHPINPELFFVLEQTQASTSPAREEYNPARISQYSKANPERLHRKLIFDAVNEILVEKLALVGPSTDPWMKSHKLAKKTLSAQKLLKELCSEIEKIQSKNSECRLEEEDDGLKNILWDDVMHGSASWIGYDSEVSGLVLDVERFLFKELVDEIVIGEAAASSTKSRRRKLFGK